MKRISKTEYYLGIAKMVAQRSPCLKKHYGCIIVKNDEIIATGYNGNPRGFSNCCEIGKCKRLHEESNSGNYGNCYSVHAEQNAMLSVARKDMLEANMYLYGEEVFGEFHTKEIENPMPCPICSRMIANAGIDCVITNHDIYNCYDLLKENKHEEILSADTNFEKEYFQMNQKCNDWKGVNCIGNN